MDETRRIQGLVRRGGEEAAWVVVGFGYGGEGGEGGVGKKGG